MRQYVYFSTATGRQDAIVTAAILDISRSRNLGDKITGLLVAGGLRYLQVIEGPDNAIEAVAMRIRRDLRHQSMTALVDRPIQQRNFPGWSMAFRAEPAFGEFATFQQMVDQMRREIVEPSLREQLDCFSSSFAVTAIQPLALPWTMARRYDPALALDRSH